MFYVHRYRIEPEKSETLFEDPFTEESLAANWEITGGVWKAENGTLTGCNRENGGALIYSRRQFPGDVMLDFYGTMVPPCRNDLNFCWRSRGWDFAKNDADLGYIAGIGGWWTGRTGVERYPECDIFALSSSLTPESGKEYHIQAGIVGHMCFVAVDGTVILEMRDPDPIDLPGCNRVGLGTYCSRIRFRGFRVARPKWTWEDLSYTPEF